MLQASGESLTTNSVDHIAKFFMSYPTFSYDSTAAFMDNFFDLCDQMRWDRHSSRRRAALRSLEDAMVKTFNNMYGTMVDDLFAWRRICLAIGIEPVPDNLNDCRGVRTGPSTTFSRDR